MIVWEEAPDVPVLLVASDVGGALEASTALGRRGFNGCAFCWCFFPEQQCPQQLSNCCGMVEERTERMGVGWLSPLQARITHPRLSSGCSRVMSPLLFHVLPGFCTTIRNTTIAQSWLTPLIDEQPCQVNCTVPGDRHPCTVNPVLFMPPIWCSCSTLTAVFRSTSS